MTLKYLGILLATAFMAFPAAAKDKKFVGVWEGNFGTPIYTKIVFHKDQSLTYCDVSSCQYVNCMKMDFTGSLKDKFSYEDATGKYEFSRISEEEIEAKFINVTGDVSTALYEPE